MRAQLARILTSTAFKRAPRMQRLLTFLVDELLAGHADQLKEYTIAIGVFDKPADFDPGTSAVIRVEAGRLRRMLEEYRNGLGRGDEFVIEIPKGSYVPVLNPLHAAADDSEIAVALPEPTWLAGDERRLVTVMSCALSDDRSSAEDALDRNFLTSFESFQEISSTVATMHGGAADGHSSDRALFYFGWPEPLEDAAGHALTAALEIVEALRTVAAQEDFGVRIGIATGEVVIRSGSGVPAAPSVIGPAPSLATAMLQSAPVNGVLVAEATRRLVGNTFNFVPLASVEGPERDPALLWRLIGPAAVATRFLAQRGAEARDIIGRLEEVALLEGKWRLSVGGEGQVLAIVGEAGIGKSILAEAAAARTTGAAVLRLQCSPHHSNSTLYPVIELLRQLIPTVDDEGDGEASIGGFLEALALDGEHERPLLAALLSHSEGRGVEELPASRQKDLTLHLLARWLAAQAEREPTLLLIEDLHWSDPTTLEWLQDVARLTAGRRLMILLTSRTDVTSAFNQLTNLTLLRLAGLPKGDSDLLISRMASSAPLPPTTREAILARAEGIPLFIEELTRLCLGSESIRTNAQVPASLSDLLASQLGRLGSARPIAQMAAVVGRQFSSEMVRLAIGCPEAEIDSALDRLLAAGVVTRSISGAGGSYQFRHALLRDAAYESVLEQRRRELHGRVAAIFVENFPDVAADHPEVIAGHLMDAGEFADAFPFWVDAGAKAAGRYALAEAGNDYRQALAALSHLPASAENAERELEVLISLGQVVRSAHGYGHEDLLDIYSRARVIADRLGDDRQLANAVYGLWTHAGGRGKWPDAEAIAGEFEGLTSSSKDDSQLHVEAHRLLGASAAFRGDFHRAVRHFGQAMETYDIRNHAPDYGFDPGAASAAYLAWVLWHVGDQAAARENARLALAIAEEKAHAPTLAMVLSWLMFHAICEKDLETIAEYNERLQAVCAERECRYWQPFGSACAEWASFEADGNIAHLDRLLAFTNAFRERYFTSSLLLLAADICLRKERPAQGLELTQAAQQFIEEHDERLWEAEAHRLTAEFQLRLYPADIDKAQRSLKRAIQTAHRQGAIVLERRAADRLTRLAAGTASSRSRSTSEARASTLH